MDPVSLIVTALVAGATRSLEGVAEDSLKSAYTKLKGLVSNFFKDQPVAEDALGRIETSGDKSEKYKPLLEDYIQESGAAQDDEVVQAAQKLLELTDPKGFHQGQYNITVSGGIHADRGGAASVHMNNVQAGYRGQAGGEPDPT